MYIYSSGDRARIGALPRKVHDLSGKRAFFLGLHNLNF